MPRRCRLSPSASPCPLSRAQPGLPRIPAACRIGLLVVACLLRVRAGQSHRRLALRDDVAAWSSRLRDGSFVDNSTVTSALPRPRRRASRCCHCPSGAAWLPRGRSVAFIRRRTADVGDLLDKELRCSPSFRPLPWPVAVTVSGLTPVPGSGLPSGLRSVFGRTPGRTPGSFSHRRSTGLSVVAGCPATDLSWSRVSPPGGGRMRIGEEVTVDG
jgi:hypothetical protein